MKPTIYLLCGLPGSGKSTYARKLEAEDTVRYTLDEELFKRFGRHFEYGYSEKEEETKRQLKEQCIENIRTGKSVIFDFGFWKSAEREEYKRFAENLGAEWKLLYFPVPESELKRRLQLRNRDEIERNHHISEDLLDTFIRVFEPPVGEDETTVKSE